MAETLQCELLQPTSANPLSSFRLDNGDKAFIAVGCSKTKRSRPSKARDLYTSSRFQTSVDIAELYEADYAILSGKHGLVEPDKTLYPYDVDISNLEVPRQAEWAASVLDDLKIKSSGKSITLLATGNYACIIDAYNRKLTSPLPISFPLLGLDEYSVSHWLETSKKIALRVRDMQRLYILINSLQETGKVFPLCKLNDQKLPKQGVYLFIDMKEINLLGKPGRIVRIGTHAISSGSRSTLRNRLKTHLGPKDGTGNHRSSIFRLHVGQALFSSLRISDCNETWGADKPATSDLIVFERHHEKLVTEYLANLLVCIIPVLDSASRFSLRALIEKQIISLYSENFLFLETPSCQWLGRHSHKTIIASSGLWNLQHVGSTYDPDGAGNIKDIENVLHAES
jgi:hypothetical protein